MAKATTKRPAAPSGPVMVSVTTTQAHRAGGQDRAVGDRYEIEEINLGAVVPRYATRESEARPQPAAAVVQSGGDAASARPKAPTKTKPARHANAPAKKTTTPARRRK